MICYFVLFLIIINRKMAITIALLYAIFLCKVMFLYCIVSTLKTKNKKKTKLSNKIKKLLLFLFLIYFLI